MVTLLGVLGALVVLMGVALVATRSEGAVLAPAEPDRPDIGLPDGTLLGEHLHRVRFGLAIRGYRMSEVDAVLDRAAEALAEQQRRVQTLQAQRTEQPRPGGPSPGAVSLEKG